MTLGDRLILLQLERGNAVDVVVGDLEDVVRLAQRRREDPIEHALVVMEVTQRVRRDVEVVENALFHLKHRVVVGIDRRHLRVGKPSGIGDSVDVNVEERHEDSDDEALSFAIGVAHGVPQRIGSTLDLDDAFIRADFSLIQDDPVGGREKVAQVRIGRADGISEEVIL